MIFMDLKGCCIDGKMLRLGKNFDSNTLVCLAVGPEARISLGRKGRDEGVPHLACSSCNRSHFEFGCNACSDASSLIVAIFSAQLAA